MLPSKEFPQSAHDLSGQIREGNKKFSIEIKGINFDEDISLEKILQSFKTTGIQASNLYKAIEEIKRMRKANAKIFFGCTSNVISSGMREIVKFLVKNKFIDVLVCTGGGIEEDIIKCMKPTYLGEFDLDGKELRETGWNRIGNMVIQNENYFEFEKFMKEFVEEFLNEESDDLTKVKDDYNNKYTVITPSQIINRLGKKINNEESVLYWCYKNKIPVYSTAITDGSLGDMLSFHSRSEEIKLDILKDTRKMSFECFSGRENGAIIIGSGLVKHMIFNANLFNNGLEYCVLVNTAVEYDASDSGASISESYSWGKVKPDGNCIKVQGEASLILPWLIYGGFKSDSLFNNN
ncbi:hypothetical protein NUSPORA_00723 [Nucleospora cyclopteri]